MRELAKGTVIAILLAIAAASTAAEKADRVVVKKSQARQNGFGWLAPVAQRFNWTDGCVAVSNADMDIIWQAVDIGTPIEILP